MDLIQQFHKPIIELLGGKDKFYTYPIITDINNIPPKIGIGILNEIPFFTLTYKYRGNIYTEIFRQISKYELILECTAKTNIFIYKNYDLSNLDLIGIKNINNLKNLVNGNNNVIIYNYTNGLGHLNDFFSDYVELI